MNENIKVIVWLISFSLLLLILGLFYLLKKIIDYILDRVFTILLKIQSYMFIFTEIRKDTKITMFNIVQKREGNKFYLYYKYLFMPTRLYSEIIKEKAPDKFLIYMKKMTLFSLITGVVIVFCFCLISISVDSNNLFDFFYVEDNSLINLISRFFLYFISLWSISRIIEITYAFIHDARTHLKPKEKSSNIPYYERIHLAMVSYLELIVLFGILYFCLNSLFCAFNMDITIIDAIYFSGVTITTLGYGDIQPVFWITKILSILEVLCGFTLIIVSFTVYVSRAINDLEKTS